MNDARTTGSRYFVSHNNEVTGPFDLDMIEAFILSGYYPPDVRICAEGSDQWRSHSPTVETTPRASAATPAAVTSSPSGGISKWKIVVGVCAIVGIGILILGGGRSTAPVRTISNRPAATPYSYATPRLATYSTPRTSYSPPAAVATPEEVLYTGADGQSYRVSNSDYRRLSTLKSAIEEEEVSLNAAIAQFEIEQESLDRQRAYLDRTSQSAIDRYNGKVDAVNAKKTLLQRRTDNYSARINSFNADLERVGTRVR